MTQEASVPCLTIKRLKSKKGVAGKTVKSFFALKSDAPASPQTALSIRYDAKKLHLRFYAKEKNRHPDTVYLRNNIVEAFLDAKHDHGSYYHVLVNMLGECDVEHVTPGNRAEAWNPRLNTKVRFKAGEWITDLEIPLADLGVRKIQPGLIWGANFVRTSFSGYGNFQYSSAHPMLPRFRCPELYGHLAFERCPTGGPKHDHIRPPVQPLIKVTPSRYFYRDRETPWKAKLKIGLERKDWPRHEITIRIMPAGKETAVGKCRIASITSATLLKTIHLHPPAPGKYELRAALLEKRGQRVVAADTESFYKTSSVAGASAGGDNFPLIMRGMEINRCFGRLDGVLIKEGKNALKILCHPDWFIGATAREIMRMNGFAAMEVFNLTGNTVWSEKWDYLLSHGSKVWAIASDDSHNVYSNAGKGWIVAKLRKITPRSVIRALKAGSFYLSSGPALETAFHDRASGLITVRLPANAGKHRINFIGLNGKILESVTGIRASLPVAGRRDYIRVEIVDLKDKNKRAWTQPFFLKKGLVYDPYRVAGSWVRGNTHTHTTCSVNDGMTSPAETAEWYWRHGYGFLAITDHDVVTR